MTSSTSISVLVTKIKRNYFLSKEPFIEYRLSVIKEKDGLFQELGFVEHKKLRRFLEKLIDFVEKNPEFYFPAATNGKRFSRSKQKPVPSDKMHLDLLNQVNMLLLRKQKTL